MNIAVLSLTAYADVGRGRQTSKLCLADQANGDDVLSITGSLGRLRYESNSCRSASGERCVDDDRRPRLQERRPHGRGRQQATARYPLPGVLTRQSSGL